MLSILLLLAAEPQAETAQPSLPLPTVQQLIDVGALPAPFGSTVPGVIGLTPEHCRNPVTQANEPTVPGANLRWRDGSPRVALYRLLDRYVGGCPAPIIVNYRIGGSHAVGREFGRDPAPLPGSSPRP